MPDLKDDIEKYLKGQLGQAEMHALEKKALNDPFLADALEGADFIGVDDFLTDVKELNHRIGNKQKGSRPWITVWRIAASVALLVGMSYVIYNLVLPKEPATLAQKTSKDEALPPSKDTVTDSDAKSPLETPKEQLLSLSTPVTSQPKRAAKEEDKPHSEPAKPLSLATDHGESKAASGAIVEQADDQEQAKAGEIIIPESKEKIASAEQGPSERKKKDVADRQSIPSKVEFSTSSAPRPGQQAINGKVTDADDGHPIPGANVFVKGSPQGAVSDVNGNYQLITDSPGTSLVVSFIGYETKEVNLPAGNSPVNIQLLADVSALSEVVVTGYSHGGGESALEAPVQLAEPVGGKRAYNKYLEKNLRYPQPALEQKLEGRVTVEFTVQSDGTLSNITVVRGLDTRCNEEVIRLVKAGPSWKPSSKADVPINSTVRVRVRFKLPK